MRKVLLFLVGLFVMGNCFGNTFKDTLKKVDGTQWLMEDYNMSFEAVFNDASEVTTTLWKAAASTVPHTGKVFDMSEDFPVEELEKFLDAWTYYYWLYIYNEGEFDAETFYALGDLVESSTELFKCVNANLTEKTMVKALLGR